MNQEQAYQQLTDVFQDVFDDDDITLEPSTSASDIGEWDSLNHLNIILGVEQKFGVKFKTSEVAQLKNVGEFVELILTKLSN